MSYAIKYRCEFTKRRGNIACKYEILEMSYSGAVEALQASGTPVIISHQGSSTDPLTPVLGSTFKGTFIALGQPGIDRQYQEFIYVKNRQYRVDYYEDSTLFWQGYVLPDNYQEQYIAPPYTVTILATDQLGDLRNFKYQKKGGNLITEWTNVDYDTFLTSNDKVLSAITDGSAVASAISNEFEVKEGDQVLLTFPFVLNSGTAPTIGIRSTSGGTWKSNSVSVTAGSKLITLTATEDVFDAVIYWYNTAVASNWTTGLVLVQFIDLIKSGWQRDSVIIADCLKQTGLTLEIQENINLLNEYQNITNLSGVKSNQDIFLDEDNGLEVPWDCYKVIEEILRPYGARVLQVNNKWRLLRIDNQRADYDVRRYTYNGIYIAATTFDPIKDFTTVQAAAIVRPVEQSGILTSLPGWQYMIMKQIFGYSNLIRNGGFENSNEAVRLRRWDARGNTMDPTRIIKFWEAKASLVQYYVATGTLSSPLAPTNNRITYTTSGSKISSDKRVTITADVNKDKEENLVLILSQTSGLAGYLYTGSTASDQHLAYDGAPIEVTAGVQWFKLSFDTKVLANAAGITAGIKTGLRIWIENSDSAGSDRALRLKAGTESELEWTTDASLNVITGIPITENDVWKTFELITSAPAPVSGILHIELHRHYMTSGVGAIIGESYYDNIQLFTAKDEAIVPAEEITEIELGADNTLIPDEIACYFGDGYGEISGVADDLYLYKGIKRVTDVYGDDQPSNGVWSNVSSTYTSYKTLLGWLQEYLKITRQTPCQIFRGSIIGDCSFLSVYRDSNNGNRLFPTNIVQSYNPREDIWQIEAVELPPSSIEITMLLDGFDMELEIVIPTIEVGAPAGDSVSLNPDSLGIAGGDSDSSQVTSSGTWNTSTLSDPDGILASYTASGTTGEYLNVFVNNLGGGVFENAVIRVTVGTATADLTITYGPI